MIKISQHIKLTSSPKPILIIGAGGIVKDAHLPAYEMAKFNVAGIYDPDTKKAKALKEQFSIVEQVFDSMEELVRYGESHDVVYDMAVPADKIISVLRQLPDDSAVLIQKPMGENAEEALSIRDLCHQKKLTAAINFQLRTAPYILAAKSMIDQNLIGRVFDIELKVRVHTPWELWDFLKGLPRLEILYHSIHYLDLVRSFWGNPYKIYANSKKSPFSPDLADTRSSMILDYEEDKQARIITDHGHHYHPDKQQSYLMIQGTEGAILITIGVSLDYPYGQPPKFEYLRTAESDKGWQEIPLEGGWFPHAFIGTMTRLQNHIQNPNEPLPTSVDESYKTMKLVDLAYYSSETGGTVFYADQF